MLAAFLGFSVLVFDILVSCVLHTSPATLYVTFRPKAKRKADSQKMAALIAQQAAEKAEKLARKNKGKGGANKKTFTVNANAATAANAANAAGTSGGSTKTSVLHLRLCYAPAVSDAQAAARTTVV